MPRPASRPPPRAQPSLTCPICASTGLRPASSPALHGKPATATLPRGQSRVPAQDGQVQPGQAHGIGDDVVPGDQAIAHRERPGRGAAGRAARPPHRPCRSPAPARTCPAEDHRLPRDRVRPRASERSSGVARRVGPDGIRASTAAGPPVTVAGRGRVPPLPGGSCARHAGARLARFLAATGVRPTIGAISSNGTANKSCSTKAIRSAGASRSSTTSIRGRPSR